MLERATYPSVPLQDNGRIPQYSAKVQSPIYQCSLQQYVLCFLPVFTLKGCVTLLQLCVIPAETLCGSPPVLELTERVWDNALSPGSTVHYYCKGGFYNTGGLNVSVCNKDGQWSLPTLSCQGNDSHVVVFCVPVVFLFPHYICVTVASSMQNRHLYVNFTNLIKESKDSQGHSENVKCRSYWHQFLSKHMILIQITFSVPEFHMYNRVSGPHWRFFILFCK